MDWLLHELDADLHTADQAYRLPPAQPHGHPTLFQIASWPFDSLFEGIRIPTSKTAGRSIDLPAV